MTENELPVQVFSETELVERLESNGHVFSHCISIRNPDQQMPAAIRAAFKSILELKFYDVESADQLGPAQAIKRVPERRDVRGVVEHFRVTRSDASGYTIHCWQGISRSPAIALGILHLMTQSEKKVAETLRRLKPDVRPHQGLVKFFDEELSCSLSPFNDEIHRQTLDSLRRELSAFANAGLDELSAVDEPSGLLARARAIRRGP